ncbi:dihydrolipoyl dehydrogenase [Microbacterium sp.]|uniref:dihydrolipoyl dehydrogenase n=1 Tax=Microbacterium sp. TaxID=51671 RepID=UPI002736DF77|nr:dihydrolipoyl dehydrogenase [Microbacterium sp.]MDP3950414.1 dihydrolipoyl dehydrogenase [Microbacterium sp.]
MGEPGNIEYDVLVLGAGSGGYATALRAAALGLSVALIEKDLLGGTCLHNGCIPTKATLHAAELADSMRASKSMGIRSTFDGVDVQTLQAFKAATIARLHKGLQGLVAHNPAITYVEGTGRLLDDRTIDVDGALLRGRHIVLATGSTARTLPGIPIGGRILTSTEALALPEIPSSVVIIGGSVIGVEFASAWTSLGASVTVVESLPTLLPQEDPAVIKQVERAFRRRGITVKASAEVTSIHQGQDAVNVGLADGTTLKADYALVAIGRAPASADLGLASAGVQTERGWVVTDGRLSTNADGVYAVGDLVSGPQLAHRGFAHGIFVAEEIAGLHPEPVIDAEIPRVTYCQPEVTSVGLTEPQAREQFDDIDVVEYSLAGNGKSQILETSGLVKIVRRTEGPVVGVHLVGARVSEQSGEATLLVGLGLNPDTISRLIHAHPTQSEALGEALLAIAGKPLHTHA